MDRMLAGLMTLALMATTGCAITEKLLQEKGLKPLSQAELEQRFARPLKVNFVTDENRSGTAEYSPDGTVRLAWARGGATGKWRIEDGKFCST